MARGWKSPCGIHMVRASRSDIQAPGPCPYCERVNEEVRGEPLGRSKFAIGPGRKPVKNDRKAAARRRYHKKKSAQKRAAKKEAAGV